MKDIKTSMMLYQGEQFEADDLENRRLFINDVIDSDVIDTIVYHILRYNREDKDIPVESRKPILLYVNTNGGSVPDGYALIDAIMTSKTPVYTINQGYCYSMGFLIFISGKKRFATPNSTFLMHDGSSFAWDSTAKMKDRVDFEAGQLKCIQKIILLHRQKLMRSFMMRNIVLNGIFIQKKLNQLVFVIILLVKIVQLMKLFKEGALLSYFIGEKGD